MATAADSYSSDEEIFRELEKDDDHLTDRMRETRMAQIQQEIESRKKITYGTYETICDEKKLMLMTTSTPKMVIHFAHKDFKRCRIMDKHLAILAAKHGSTRFVRVDVENVPFLVDRMEIKVLPCIISFIDGVGKDRLLGFEGIAENDSFPTWMLEKRLSEVNVIKLDVPKRIIKFAEREDSDEDY